MAAKTIKRKTNKGIRLIKKSNNLIESRYKFDIWETRFFLSVLSQIRKDDEEFEVYRVWYKDVIKTFGLKSGDSYKYLRLAAQNLMGKSFFLDYEENGIKREKQYHILREIDYLKEGEEVNAPSNEEYIDVTVEQKMKPLLIQLKKNFTAYDLRNIVKLGVYPVRVYELLKQYQSIGSRKLEIDEMKRMFEVTEQYKLFADFFRWVIKPAVKEINKHTDLTISNVEKIKKGRRVVALQFFFHPKKDKELEEVRNAVKPEDLEKMSQVKDTELYVSNETTADELFDKYHETIVKSFGVTASSFLSLLKNVDEEAIEKAIRVTRRAKANNDIKKNIAGFFVKALKEGYTDPKEAERQKSKEKKVALKTVKQKIRQLETEKDKLINQKIRKVVEENSEITKLAIEKIKSNIYSSQIITQKEQEHGRLLTIDDFRDDKQLRELVKMNIVELSKGDFEEILKTYGEKIKLLKKGL